MLERAQADLAAAIDNLARQAVTAPPAIEGGLAALRVTRNESRIQTHALTPKDLDLIGEFARDVQGENSTRSWRESGKRADPLECQHWPPVDCSALKFFADIWAQGGGNMARVFNDIWLN